MQHRGAIRILENLGRELVMSVLCGMKGNTIERCYKKHGYPPGVKLSNTTFKASMPAAVNNSEVNAGNTSSGFMETNALMGNDTTTGSSYGGYVQAPLITQDQYSHLMTLLQNVPAYTARLAGTGSTELIAGQASILQAVFGHSNVVQQTSGTAKCEKLHSIKWILDSGASNHICPNLVAFDSSIPVDNVTVKLPNGTITPITHEGSVVLNPILVLINVYYVPNFAFNLISVTQLSKSSCSRLIFDDSINEIQDRVSLKRIRYAKVSQDLYYLDKVSDSVVDTHTASTVLKFPTCNVAITQTFPSDLFWHYRYGHLSSPRLQMVKSTYPFVELPKQHNCTICSIAKQKRLSFS